MLELQDLRQILLVPRSLDVRKHLAFVSQELSGSRDAAYEREVDPSDGIREAAVRFLRVHPLRVADALQLAAAFVAAEGRPSSLDLITLDDRLAAAARKEGFAVIEVPQAG